MTQTAPPKLAQADRDTLMVVAASSVTNAVAFGRPMTIFLNMYSPALREKRACFVTLEIDGRLRGCIGTLIASRPLIEDVAENACSAALRDPRFKPVSKAELPPLTVHVSILSPAEPMNFKSEADLLAQLRPGIDGLILEETIPQAHRGTFLPTVWGSIRDPKAFLEQLKLKAGLLQGYWSPTIKVSRYTTELLP